MELKMNVDIAERSFKYVVVTDGIEGSPFYDVQKITWSFDSRHMAYEAGLSLKWAIVVDEAGCRVGHGLRRRDENAVGFCAERGGGDRRED
jgi:hypothetical protein